MYVYVKRAMYQLRYMALGVRLGYCAAGGGVAGCVACGGCTLHTPCRTNQLSQPLGGSGRLLAGRLGGVARQASRYACAGCPLWAHSTLYHAARAPLYCKFCLCTTSVPGTARMVRTTGAVGWAGAAAAGAAGWAWGAAAGVAALTVLVAMEFNPCSKARHMAAGVQYHIGSPCTPQLLR